MPKVRRNLTDNGFKTHRQCQNKRALEIALQQKPPLIEPCQQAPSGIVPRRLTDVRVCVYPNGKGRRAGCAGQYGLQRNAEECLGRIGVNHGKPAGAHQQRVGKLLPQRIEGYCGIGIQQAQSETLRPFDIEAQIAPCLVNRLRWRPQGHTDPLCYAARGVRRTNPRRFGNSVRIWIRESARGY